ncbi:MAG: glycosyltransferase family 4 protein, partial [Candidatus Parcubacteria bacterium]|nr:glycosyltransferase family 4 protein [Candidatus Parcubacteria bacterium]
NGFLFETSNHKHLAEQALRLITDENLRKEMGERSLLKSKAYDINESVIKLENLYYSVFLGEI